MEHTLRFKVDDKRLTHRLETEATREIEIQIRTVLNDGSNGLPKGELFKVIEGSIEHVVLSDQTMEIVNRVVKRSWESLLESAVVSALEHKANKVAFTEVKKLKSMLQVVA